MNQMLVGSADSIHIFFISSSQRYMCPSPRGIVKSPRGILTSDCITASYSLLMNSQFFLPAPPPVPCPLRTNEGASMRVGIVQPTGAALRLISSDSRGGGYGGIRS